MLRPAMSLRLATFGVVIITGFALMLAHPASAKGPNSTKFDVQLNGGEPVGIAGQAVAFEMNLRIDDWQELVPPAEYGHVESVLVRNPGIESAIGPGLPGAFMTPNSVGTKVGLLTYGWYFNWIAYLTHSQNIPPDGEYAGVLPNCGDNYDTTWTRLYVPSGGPLHQAMGWAWPNMTVFQGNMAARDVRPTSMMAPGWVAAEYSSAGGPLVQAYDDDNDNGMPDELEGAPNNEPAGDGSSSNPPHPYALTGLARTYIAGQPETQHDDDADGVPNAMEYMPDSLGPLVDALGLTSLWVNRAYTIWILHEEYFAPRDAHMLWFNLAGIGGSGSVMIVVIGNPFLPPDPAIQWVSFCSPLTYEAAMLAESTRGSICPMTYCSPPAAVSEWGYPVLKLASNGTHATTAYLSDEEDYDQDGLVGPADLCSRSPDNSDPDGDLFSGICDPAPASDDNDGDGAFDFAPSINSLLGIKGVPLASCQTSGNGICDNDVDDDGWINNIDNCETDPNPSQADADGDTIGDPCDALPSVKGSGNNTTELIDNDMACSDSWSTSGAREFFGDGVPAGGCANVNDANDDGVYDAVDNASDEDADGFSDAAETSAGSNPLDPTSRPTACIVNPAGVPAPGDLDGDHFLDSCGDDAGNADQDGDGVKDGIEFAAGTPLDGGSGYPAGADTDGDGCLNEDEKSPDATAGGMRHPGNYWDFFDVNGTGDIDLSDTLKMLQHFGHGPADDATDQQLDRDGAIAGVIPPGLVRESNSGIDLSDALRNLTQFGHGGCGIPGPVPSTGGGRYP